MYKQELMSEASPKLSCEFVKFVSQLSGFVKFASMIRVAATPVGIPFSREKNYEITYKGVILPHYYYAEFVVLGRRFSLRPKLSKNWPIRTPNKS